MYLADVFTVQANMVGVPAICLPIGRHSQGTGIGLQFMGSPWNDENLLCFSKKIKKLLSE